jgi:acyl-CoA reductase-like NAD-dependent aldehyde dehydrogenase
MTQALSTLPGPGFFVARTVLVDVADEHEVAGEEIFGPMVTVETFADRGAAPLDLRARRDARHSDNFSMRC